MRIFMESNDRDFREKVRNLFPAGVNILTRGNRRNGNVKALAEDAHLAFIEYRSLYDFKDIMPGGNLKNIFKKCSVCTPRS
jgi:hypothetical protein